MENSKKLLDYALTAIEEANIPMNRWTVGGGTVLASIYNHRRSKDIDVFIDDIQFLSRLSPKLNTISEQSLYYAEEARYISLTFLEGKVDFVYSPQVTEFLAQE